MRRRRWDLLAAPPIAAVAVGASVALVVGTAGLSPPAQPPLARPLKLTWERPPRRVDLHAARPTRVQIGAIGVSAPVVPLGLAADGSMETPKRFSDAGWYSLGARPGEPGPAVIAGHVDSKTGPAIFYRLGELHRGDMVRIVRADGSAVRFRVEGLERWPKTRFPTRRVFGPTRAPTLRLVTCSGAFDSSTGHYLDNTIVYAVRVSAPVHHAAVDRLHEADVMRLPALLPLDRLEQHRARPLHLAGVAP
jgi:hypothetical protein